MCLCVFSGPWLIYWRGWLAGTGDIAQGFEGLSSIRACGRPSREWVFTFCPPWPEAYKIRFVLLTRISSTYARSREDWHGGRAAPDMSSYPESATPAF